MIDLLKPLHILCSFNANTQISPIQVPATVLRHFFHPVTRCYSPHNLVLAIACTDGEESIGLKNKTNQIF